jgi:hypothetical protein
MTINKTIVLFYKKIIQTLIKMKVELKILNRLKFNQFKLVRPKIKLVIQS